MSQRKVQIPDELKKYAPFHHDIDLGEGFNTSPGNYRIKNAINLFFPGLLKLSGGTLEGKRILDIGCNCGGFSFAAAKFGAKEVIGIDPREIHIQQANAVKEYLKLKNIHFYQDRLENLSREKYGEFDICILAGVIYHLKNPIDAMKIISDLTKEIIMVDSHVHYSSDTALEDIPSWWMLPDTDMYDFDGLYENHSILNKEQYLNFEKNNPVDYSQLRNQFVPSPHTLRDIQFAKNIESDPFATIPQEDSLCSIEPGELSMIPNKKALIKLLRYNGFEDILEITPHRFSEERYIRKYRIGLFGLKRNGTPFDLPVLSKKTD